MALAALSPITPRTLRECVHCRDAIPSARAASTYCCDGCEAAARLLAEMGIGAEYYALRGDARRGIKPESIVSEDYAALDEPPFRARPDAPAELAFFLEGIHCAACVFVLEKLPRIAAGVAYARLDTGRSTLRIGVNAQGSFAAAARILVRLGYRPHPVRTAADAEANLRNQDRAILRRIGVAGFAAMNVMIYSVSLYAGVGGAEGVLFRVLSLVTALPALTYSAWPFYANAWRALRARRISIDLPVSLAFVGGFAESLRQTFLGANLLYLDSLTSLVFLLLISRYSLVRLERAETARSGILHALLPARVRRIESLGPAREVARLVRPEALRAGDVFEITAGGRFPADGRVESGVGLADLTFLTGEAKPIPLRAGEPVYAGSKLVDGKVRVCAEAVATETRLGTLERKLERLAAPAAHPNERSERWATMFLAAVLGFTVLLLALFGPSDLGEAMRRSLSLLIIACPCALALATPLTKARALKLAASRGILLRDPGVLDRLASVDTVVFDKTGTLTLGEPRVVGWRWLTDEPRDALRSIAYTLERNAANPYGRAIARDLENRPGVRDLAFTARPDPDGSGVSAELGGDLYRMGRAREETSRGGIALTRGRRTLALVEFEDLPRADAFEVRARLERRGLAVRLLSGDDAVTVARIARAVGIRNYVAGAAPETKKAEIDAIERDGAKTLFIGDGVNDSLALRSATVGAAFARGNGATIESALIGAPVALLRTDLHAVADLFEIARRYRRTLTRNAIFSALYNLAGATLAVSGVVHPLVAAIAMPASALTVFLSTAAGLRAGVLARKEGT